MNPDLGFLSLLIRFFFAGYIENGGTVSDYINTALQGHYDTDFPELTSKFENFSLSANDNQDMF